MKFKYRGQKFQPEIMNCSRCEEREGYPVRGDGYAQAHPRLHLHLCLPCALLCRVAILMPEELRVEVMEELEDFLARHSEGNVVLHPTVVEAQERLRASLERAWARGRRGDAGGRHRRAAKRASENP